MNLDKTDVKIIELLKKDGRLSIRALGRQVHLSPPSVAERVKKLEDEAILTGYTVRVNRKKLGFVIDCFVEVSLRNGDIIRFKTFVETCSNILFCIVFQDGPATS
ncbi:Lrp/AsnC family transcriptional regulator [Terrilactibacillus sp. S3-3]|nr:Lrp/AsnC family transcriptional regulator [Terrilactibacillus sp. S3-3]